MWSKCGVVPELLYRWGSYGNSRFKASCLGEGAFYIEIFRGPGRAKPTVLRRNSCFYYHATSFSSVDCYSWRPSGNNLKTEILFPQKVYFKGGKLKKTDARLPPKLLEHLHAPFGNALDPFDSQNVEEMTGRNWNLDFDKKCALIFRKKVLF